jgi:arylsulfatase A-like enzyme
MSSVVMLLVPLTGCGVLGGPPADHVIVISLDTTRADMLGCYGNGWVETPHLDALARESILFEDFLVTAPTTVASHASLFTGKHPHTHGAPRNGFVVNGRNVMLAEILSDAGFHTAAFPAAFVIGSRFAFDQGFDVFDEVFVGDRDERPADEITDSVLAHLETRDASERLFLFVHYYDPHWPYRAPPPYDRMYGARPDLWAPADLKRAMESEPERMAENNALTREVTRRYAAEITFMDSQIGRLLEGLADRGILDRAVVVVTSDHGENLWRHADHFAHGRNVYQSSVQGVCLVRLPAAEGGGTRVSGWLGQIDLLPSLLGFLRLPSPDGIDGRALDLTRPIDSLVERPQFAQATKPFEAETDPRWHNLPKARCVVVGRHKFIQVPYQDREELYDLVDDPHEMDDLLRSPAPAADAIADELRRELEDWASSADPLPTVFEPDLPLDTMERLRRLGYVE